MDPASVAALFAPFGPVRTRRMFGGVGVYSGPMMIALEAYGSLWFKVDAQTRNVFEAAGSRPFVYEAEGRKPVVTSYWLAPEEALEDPDVMRRWARLAEDAARRAAAAPKGRGGTAVP
jgi:DNA transformation protein